MWLVTGLAAIIIICLEDWTRLAALAPSRPDDVNALGTGPRVVGLARGALADGRRGGPIAADNGAAALGVLALHTRRG